MARPRKARLVEGKLDPRVEEIVKQITRAEQAYHTEWQTEVTRRWDDYHAIVKQDWPDDDWHSHVYEPHIVPVIEGMLAAHMEMQPHLLCTPRPRPLETMEQAQARADSASVAEVAVNWALQNDDFVAKQRPLIHQDLVTGLTAGKFFWEERAQKVYERKFFDSEELDEDTGTYVPVRDSEVDEREEMVRDDPTLRVLDVRDFFWPANCRDLEEADWLADRAYVTMERIQELEDLGTYEKGTTAKLKETALAQQGKPGERPRYGEGGTEGPLRTDGLVEVIERWTSGGVCTVGNRQVLMREGKNEFWHGSKPYVTATAIPNPFQVNGKSIVETLAPIQRELWFLSNQSMDNLKLLNNLIYLIRADQENAKDFKWYPGAQWFVDDPEGAVRELQIDPTPATISLQRESLLKGELQNIMGALPGSGNVDSDTIDQKTATGMSIISSIAQQVIAARRTAYQRVFAQVGKAFLGLMQQFMLEPRTLSMLGPGGARIFTEIDPEKFQGAFDVTYDVQGDSMVRQERRAEAQTLYQMLLQAAPIQAQFGTPFNLDAIAEKLLKAFDVSNPKIYFLTPEQAQQKMSPPQNGGPSGMSGMNPAEQMQPNGQGPLGSQGNAVTAPPGMGVSTEPPMQQMARTTGPTQ